MCISQTSLPLMVEHVAQGELVFFRKSNFILLESTATLYERGAILANAITKELKAGPRLLPL